MNKFKKNLNQNLNKSLSKGHSSIHLAFTEQDTLTRLQTLQFMQCNLVSNEVYGEISSDHTAFISSPLPPVLIQDKKSSFESSVPDCLCLHQSWEEEFYNSQDVAEAAKKSAWVGFGQKSQGCGSNASQNITQHPSFGWTVWLKYICSCTVLTYKLEILSLSVFLSCHFMPPLYYNLEKYKTFYSTIISTLFTSLYTLYILHLIIFNCFNNFEVLGMSETSKLSVLTIQWLIENIIRRLSCNDNNHYLLFYILYIHHNSKILLNAYAMSMYLSFPLLEW